VIAAGVFLAYSFGIGNVLAALSRANVPLLVAVVILGAVIQVIRAQRARYLLSQDHTVTLRDAYVPMVVGHGIGDLLPLAPGGPALRCVLTERLAGIPLAFSAGVFMLEGMLDGIGPSLLIGYLLLAVTVPAWTRWMLVAALVQSTLLLVVPVLVKALSQLPQWHRFHSGRLAGLMRLGSQVAAGLVGIMTRGTRVACMVVGLSLLVTALSALQLILFLRAFALTMSVNDLFLVLVLTLAAGSIPIKFPGVGTVAATVVLRITRIHGPGLGGYVLMSRVVFSSETAVLAVALLGWWSLSGRCRCSGVGNLLRLSQRPVLEPSARK
jgi:hypothetical protein